MDLRRAFWIVICGISLLAGGQPNARAQAAPERREFPPGALQRVENLPASRLRTEIERLPLAARERATAWLGDFHFTEQDLPFLHADNSGGIFYADEFVAQAAEAEPEISSAAVAISPFPQHLVFHSRPGAPNVLYLNFTGETVVNTAWNTYVGRSTITALPFSSDSDRTTFSDSEQLAIKRIWQRVAEDYAPFNIDVTTERPASFNNRTAHALITRNTDADGQPNPGSNSGGVAYVGVFGTSSYANYRPAWIYHNNLGSEESYVAEAASHEVGHNLGLSHDGRTDGHEYYGGHGSGATSWAPLMGTGYSRNVSQWSRGEYYLASNTQDDLATIAAKLSYRSDDHGNTLGSATPLIVEGNGAIASTTPQTDPENTSPQNKGVIERNSDADWFSFAAGGGSLDITVSPWAVPSALTRGGNVDLTVELHDSSGTVIASSNPLSQTDARIQATVAEGVYYLSVRTAGVGAPSSSTPDGYTAYGSIGQYFISGTVVPSGLVTPPGAELLTAADLTQPISGSYQFSVAYSDNAAVDVSTIDSADVTVTDSNGQPLSVTLVQVDVNSNGSPRVATYSAASPQGSWSAQNNGTYQISIKPEQVADTEGAYVPGGLLGEFTVAIPSALYYRSMDSAPDWTFERQWEYGQPNYGTGGPAAGFTGSSIVAYNLSGNYENRLSPAYATTGLIDCSGASDLTLRFRRWLRTKNGDTASIEVSAGGGPWTSLWSSSKPVSDNAWQEVQYPLPASAAGNSSVRIRWGLSSGPAQNEIGWNIDDVVILGNGAVDAIAPLAVLDAPNILSAGSPVHSFTVTYSDNVAVSVASLGSSDLSVIDPNGLPLPVDFGGVDVETDGSPRAATYTLAAPGGMWTSAHNGTYQVLLNDGEVSDTGNNLKEGALLGTFTVAIADTQQALIIEPASISVPEGGEQSFTVRLAEQPGASVDVTILHTSGDNDLSLGGSGLITFTGENWSTPVPVTIHATADADQENGVATFECRSAGLAAVSVIATEIDSTPTANQPPSVTLSVGTGAKTLAAPAAIQLTASANDPDGSIARVEFFQSGTAIGIDSEPPFELSLTDVAAGVYSFTAVATDDRFAATTSDPVQLRVAKKARVTSLRYASGICQIQADGTSGITYVLEGSDDSRTWTPLGTSTAVDELLLFEDAAGPQSRIYRIRAE